jgi:hypothetical protein
MQVVLSRMTGLDANFTLEFAFVKGFTALSFHSNIITAGVLVSLKYSGKL